MPQRVLVAVASKYGHTTEIAERIAAVLAAAGLDTRVQAADEVADLGGFDAVVLGSAIYVGRWRREAVRFVQVLEPALAQVPLWLFSSGPTGEGDPEALVEEWHLPDAVLDVLDRVGVEDSVIFHGALEPETLNMAERWAIRTVGAPVGDYRDWQAIEAWGRSIAARLAPDSATAQP